MSHEDTESHRDLFAKAARLEADKAMLTASLKWALPLASLCLEDCRRKRLQTGNSDIGREEGHPGLWPDEVAARDKARAVLTELQEPKDG